MAIESKAIVESSGWFGWGASATQEGEKLTLPQLREAGGSHTQDDAFQAQSSLRFKDSGWVRSTVAPGTTFRVEIKEGEHAGFGQIGTTDDLGRSLILSQPGDSRRALSSATFVTTGVRPETLSVQPNGTRIERSFGNPKIDDITLNFFLGDGDVPVAVYDGNAEEAKADYTFNPVCQEGAREGRVQSLVVRAESTKTGSVALRVFTQVDPTVYDCASDTATGCWSRTGAGVRVVGSTITGTVRGTGTLLSNLGSSIRHPVLTAASLRNRTIVALGGQLAAIEEDKSKSE